MSVTDYNTNPVLNTAINGISIVGAAAVQNFDDALRQTLADVREFYDWYLAETTDIRADFAAADTTDRNAANTALALRLRFDAIESRTAPELVNARTTLGLATTNDVAFNNIDALGGTLRAGNPAGTNFRVRNDGLFSVDNGTYGPLTLNRGGTGATTPAGARTALELSATATDAVIPVIRGGTGSTTAANARTALGVGSGDVPTFVSAILQSASNPIAQFRDGSSNVRASVFWNTPADALILQRQSGATLALGATGDATLDGVSLARVSAATSDPETNFPIGHTVLAVNSSGTFVNRNASVTVRLSTLNTHQYVNNGAGSILSGTWRARGAFAFLPKGSADDWAGFVCERVA